MDYTAMTVIQLKNQLKIFNVKGRSKLKTKKEIIELLMKFYVVTQTFTYGPILLEILKFMSTTDLQKIMYVNKLFYEKCNFAIKYLPCCIKRNTCHMTFNLCCYCADKRKNAKQYVDGIGFVSFVSKNAYYCPQCKK